MSEPHASTSPGHPRNVNSAPDTQSGVAARSDKLWGFENVEQEIQIGGAIIPPDGSVPLQYMFMDGEEKLRNIVRDTIQRDRRPSGFETWEDYANVKFIENPGFAPIRITFVATPDDDWYWSKVGTEALDTLPKEPTMKLAGLRKCIKLLPASFPRSLAEHRGHILHEFGHALGLEHEHQGPVAQRELDLIRDEVLKDRRYCKKPELAEYNIIRRIEERDLMNYTRLDKDSIMIYDIPMNWRRGDNRDKIGSNRTLSELDKAFIQLIYPPDLRMEEEEGVKAKKFREAVVHAGVPPHAAAGIFKAFQGDNRTLADRFNSVRNCFNHLREGAWFLWNSQQNAGIAHTIDPASFQFGANGFIGDVAENRLFQSIVKNIVYRAMVQHGIPTNIPLPGSTQLQVTRMLAALAMHNDFGHHINQYVSQLSDMPTFPSTLGPQDNNSTEGPHPSSRDNTFFDVHYRAIGWAEEHKNNVHDTMATVAKAEYENTITIKVPSDGKQAVFHSDEHNSDLNRRHIDVQGSLYSNQSGDIDAGKTATWSSHGIVFHKNEHDFSACFLPSRPLPSAGPGTATMIFENVEWSHLNVV